ncbi:hypothetical protein R1flu_009895 [Riccia fluitans]|uniref:Uncharacterized protein n=1 Tax=Riccia fluitans TaxID=41844 RepID=A0ABD1Z3J2_9MARC
MYVSVGRYLPLRGALGSKARRYVKSGPPLLRMRLVSMSNPAVSPENFDKSFQYHVSHSSFCLSGIRATVFVSGNRQEKRKQARYKIARYNCVRLRSRSTRRQLMKTKLGLDFHILPFTTGELGVKLTYDPQTLLVLRSKRQRGWVFDSASADTTTDREFTGGECCPTFRSATLLLGSLVTMVCSLASALQSSDARSTGMMHSRLRQPLVSDRDLSHGWLSVRLRAIPARVANLQDAAYVHTGKDYMPSSNSCSPFILWLWCLQQPWGVDDSASLVSLMRTAVPLLAQLKISRSWDWI